MADQDDWPVLRVDDLSGGLRVALERQSRVLDDADVVAVLLEQVVDGLPAGTVHKPAVDENDVVDS